MSEQINRKELLLISTGIFCLAWLMGAKEKRAEMLEGQEIYPKPGKSGWLDFFGLVKYPRTGIPTDNYEVWLKRETEKRSKRKASVFAGKKRPWRS